MSEVEHHEVIVDIIGSIPDWCKGEIVRCRDCKYLANIGYWCAHPLQSFIDEYGMELNHKAEPNGFCSWGERKMDA